MRSSYAKNTWRRLVYTYNNPDNLQIHTCSVVVKARELQEENEGG